MRSVSLWTLGALLWAGFAACNRPAEPPSVQETVEPPSWRQPQTVELPRQADQAALAWLQAASAPLNEGTLNELAAWADEHRLVLLGESTHGTAEFYRLRAQLTRKLIERGHTNFIGVEGDWSAMARLDRYIRGVGEEGERTSAQEIMRTFHRWPEWMWANEEFAAFVEWLREYNATADAPVRLYGVDVYDAGASLQRLTALSDDPSIAPCLRAHGGDFRRYGASLRGGGASCEDEVQALVRTLRAAVEGADATEEAREAWMNAKVVAAAEAHHRAMFTGGDAESWNARAAFFFEGMEALMELHGESAGAVFWAHNTHIGDARATDMHRGGQVNVGQLARERLDEDVFVIGFAKTEGEVKAGRQWGATPEVMPVASPPQTSWDAILAQVSSDTPWMVAFRETEPPSVLREVRPQRAIGVVYHPEGGGAWVPTRLADRYDVLVFLQEGAALRAVR